MPIWAAPGQNWLNKMSPRRQMLQKQDPQKIEATKKHQSCKKVIKFFNNISSDEKVVYWKENCLKAFSSSSEEEEEEEKLFCPDNNVKNWEDFGRNRKKNENFIT